VCCIEYKYMCIMHYNMLELLVRSKLHKNNGAMSIPILQERESCGSMHSFFPIEIPTCPVSLHLFSKTLVYNTQTYYANVAIPLNTDSKSTKTCQKNETPRVTAELVQHPAPKSKNVICPNGPACIQTCCQTKKK